MSGPLIHTRRAWLPRVVDTVLTMLAWAGFLYLVVRGVGAVLELAPYSLGERLHALRVSASTLVWYLLIGACNAGVLASWALYNQIRRRVERRSAIPALDDERLSISFCLTPELLRAFRSHQIIVVHNREDGSIADVVAGTQASGQRIPPVVHAPEPGANEREWRQLA